MPHHYNYHHTPPLSITSNNTATINHSNNTATINHSNTATNHCHQPLCSTPPRSTGAITTNSSYSLFNKPNYFTYLLRGERDNSLFCIRWSHQALQWTLFKKKLDFPTKKIKKVENPQTIETGCLIQEQYLMVQLFYILRCCSCFDAQLWSARNTSFEIVYVHFPSNFFVRSTHQRGLIDWLIDWLLPSTDWPQIDTRRWTSLDDDNLDFNVERGGTSFPPVE